MKFKISSVKCEEFFIDSSDGKISFPDIYPKDEWHPEYDILTKTYMDVIMEWGKNLFTPYEFLQDIIRRIYGKNSSIILKYKLDDVLRISTIEWKCYKKFKEASSIFDKSKFNIFILYLLDDDFNAVDLKLRRLNFSSKSINDIRRNLRTSNAFCLASADDPGLGCCIVIDGSKVDSHDTATLEQKLDHELNHYFEQFNDETAAKIDDLDLNEKIMKIGQDAGYDLSNEFTRNDFIQHILMRSEFKPMIANVCNALEFSLKSIDNKYNWLIEHSTSRFLKTNEYRDLPIDIQNVLLFTTICRIYSGERWKELLEDLKVQFSKKEKLHEKVKCSLLTLIERLKRWI